MGELSSTSKFKNRWVEEINIKTEENLEANYEHISNRIYAMLLNKAELKKKSNSCIYSFAFIPFDLGIQQSTPKN